MYRQVFILSLFVTYTCYAETTASSEAAEETYCAITLPAFAFGTDWDYSDTTEWDKLTGGFCGRQSQSPINIVTANVVPIPAGTMNIAYDRNIELIMQQKVSTLEAEGAYSYLSAPDASGIIQLYKAKQFHIHTPSEHKLDGQSFPMEIHFVHFSAVEGCDKVTNQISVIGVFVETSLNAELDILDDIATVANNAKIEDFNLISSLLTTLTTSDEFFTYTGSLTTPSCAEEVNWFVLKKPIYMTEAQLTKIQDYFANDAQFPNKDNNRPVQDLNGRKVYSVPLQSLQWVDKYNELKVINLAQSSGSGSGSGDSTTISAVSGSNILTIATWALLMIIQSLF